MSCAEKMCVKQHQIDHLAWLLHEAAGEEEICAKAARVGEVHALVGLSGDVVMQAAATSMRMVNQTILQRNVPSPMALLIDYSQRIQVDTQAQLQAMEQTMMRYLQVLTPSGEGSISAQGRTRDLLVRMGQLPGMLRALAQWGEQAGETMIAVNIAP